MATQLRSGKERERIETYYDQTWYDYRCLWLSRHDLAFHFGYHDGSARSHRDALLNTNRLLAERARVTAGKRVVDAGCGVGGTCRWLAQRMQARAVGINLVPAQMAMARKLSTDLGPLAPMYVRADYTRIPLRCGSVDAVLAVESLCHAAQKGMFYAEAARVLRPGGRLVVAEYMRAARPLSSTGERLVREWVDGWAIPDLDTPGEHAANAKVSGFEDVQIENFTERARPSLRRLYRIARSTYALAFLARRLHLRSATQHGNVIAALRQFQALEQGFWLYGLLSATRA